MDSSNAQNHNQDFGSQTLESMLVCSNSKPLQDKKPRPSEQSLKCPRCDSTNTKFCYYNNYSLTQPRYFCKSCRRYWTKGGTLRNVPVGGGCRRNKRSSSCSNSSTSSSKKDQIPTSLIPSSYDEFSLSGHPNMPYGYGENSTFGGFLENEFHHNMYYGMGSENGGILGQQMGMPFQEFRNVNSLVKQEMWNGGENKILWGFPWQNIGGDGNIGEYGIGSSNWHGIMSSAALM